MDPKTKAVFDKLQSRQCNKTCIDCGGFNPQWASVNNGCFMCIKCAGNHRSMGVHITFVRSVTMDGWSKIQLARMKHGGNDKLKSFWSAQKFPKSLSPKERLDNSAMDKYRANLLSKAKGENVSPIPFIGYEAREIKSNYLNASNQSNGNSMSSNQSNGSSMSSMGSRSNSSSKMTGFGNTDYNPHENQQDDGWSEFGTWASSIAAKTSAVASDLASKSKEAAVTISSKASEKASTMKSKLGDEEYQANLKKNAAETWTKTASTLSSWWSTAQQSVQNVLTEDQDPVTLYNKDSVEPQQRSSSKRKMSALSSDQYFGNSSKSPDQNSGNTEDILGMSASTKKSIDQVEAPLKVKKTRESVEDDFDEWGFGDANDAVEAEPEQKSADKFEDKPPPEKEVGSLLDFTANNGASVNINGNDKDGNSSDDLDAFFEQMTVEEKQRGPQKAKIEAKDEPQDILSASNKKDEEEDDWGWD